MSRTTGDLEKARLTAAVVGEFDSGDAHDSELWGDVNVVGDVAHLGSNVQSVTVRLTSADALHALKFVAGIMAIGAVAAALNSMYAAVSTRTHEIATLRAIGFRGSPVVGSVMIETMLLAIVGGAGGALIAWFLFRNLNASTMGPNGGALLFQFRVTPQLMGEGLKWALAIGFLGGLFPALRAAQIPVTDALREL